LYRGLHIMPGRGFFLYASGRPSSNKLTLDNAHHFWEGRFARCSVHIYWCVGLRVRKPFALVGIM